MWEEGLFPPHHLAPGSVSQPLLTLHARARPYTQVDHTRKSRPRSGTPWKDAPVRGYL